METEIRWLRIEERNSSLIRADLFIRGVLSVTDFRTMLSTGWELQSQPYGFAQPEVYRFVRMWEEKKGGHR